MPAEEDLYALFLNGARLIRRDISSAISLRERFDFKELRKRGIKKAIKNGLIIVESNDYAGYWKVLSDVLRAQHDAKPAHSLEEILYLSNLFPHNIKLFVARKADTIMAGAVIFENSNVVHAQYLANSVEGRKSGALDYVVDRLVNSVYKDKDFFDLGTSNEDNGKYLNSGLISQKEGFGARAIAHDFYQLIIDK